MRTKKYIAMFIAILMVLTVVCQFGGAISANATKFTHEKIKIDFEHTKVCEEFSGTFEGSNASYIGAGSRMKIVGSDLAIGNNRSLAINSCDIRWWTLGVKEKQMGLEFKVGIDENYNNNLTLGINTQQPDNKDANMDVIKIRKEGAVAQLIDYEGNVLAELECGKSYDVSCEFAAGQDTYTISVGSKVVAEKAALPKKVYSVEAFHINVQENPAEDNSQLPAGESYLLIDNILLWSKGKDTPQKYSTQEKGDLPKVKIPEKSNEKIKVFLNDTKIKLEKEPVIKDGKIYFDAESLAEGLNVTYTQGSDGSFEFKAGATTIKGVAGSGEIDINGKAVTLVEGAAPIMENDAVLVTADFINEAFNAKVWWDEKDGVFAITVGEYKDNGILVSLGGKLFMNGEPYYEISFNKFDLFYQIIAEYERDGSYPNKRFQFHAAEAAVKQLSEAGFKSIRAFVFSSQYKDLMYNEEHQKTYFEAMDRLFDLCDKYDMKVVVCMGLIEPHLLALQYIEGEGWIPGDESVADIVANPDGESRQNVYKYIDLFVNRYKDRKSVLMWEIKNEGNLELDIGEVTGDARVSLLQLANFYGDCADKIRAIDDKHLITSGDSVLRTAQWNLFKAVMEGQHISWQIDTFDEHLKAVALLNEKLDVISAHIYGLGCGNTGDFVRNDENGQTVDVTWDMFMEEAATLGKAFYNGECNTAIAYDAENFAVEMEKYLDAIIDAGVQLSHWWTFRSDRVGFNDGPTWQCDEGVQWDLIIAANKKLKETYMVNGVADANAATSWEDPSFEVINKDSVKEDETIFEELPGDATEAPAVTVAPTQAAKGGKGCGSALSGGIAVIAACAVAVVFGKKRK